MDNNNSPLLFPWPI